MKFWLSVWLLTATYLLHSQKLTPPVLEDCSVEGKVRARPEGLYSWCHDEFDNYYSECECNNEQKLKAYNDELERIKKEIDVLDDEYRALTMSWKSHRDKLEAYKAKLREKDNPNFDQDKSEAFRNLNMAIDLVEQAIVVDGKRRGLLSQIKDDQVGYLEHPLQKVVSQFKSDREEIEKMEPLVSRSIKLNLTQTGSSQSTLNTDKTNPGSEVYTGDYKTIQSSESLELIKSHLNEEYIQSQGKLISGSIQSAGNLIMTLSENRRKRIQAEKRMEIMEKERQKQFRDDLEMLRNGAKQIIDARRDYMKSDSISPLYSERSEDLKPVFIYFAFVKKGYDHYEEEVKYPQTLRIRIDEKAEVNFSAVYGIFPFSNGDFPFLREVQNEILETTLGDEQDLYEVKFFQWQTSLSGIVEKLSDDMKSAVYEHSFFKAMPPSSNEIIFVNDKPGSTIINYWNLSIKPDSLINSEPKGYDYWNKSNRIEIAKDTVKKNN